MACNYTLLKSRLVPEKHRLPPLQPRKDEMKEYPIIFNTEMVRAILEDRKTQTRRIMKPQPIFKDGQVEFKKAICFEYQWQSIFPSYYPFGKVGDRLWARETWADMVCVGSTEKGKGKGENSPCYKASSDATDLKILKGYWKPSIHMPRWASRITLEITDIRVERVQDISEEECRKEGLKQHSKKDIHGTQFMYYEDYSGNNNYCTARASFKHLWNSIYGKGAWERNDWVWVLSFKKIKG